MRREEEEEEEAMKMRLVNEGYQTREDVPRQGRTEHVLCAQVSALSWHG